VKEAENFVIFSRTFETCVNATNGMWNCQSPVKSIRAILCQNTEFQKRKVHHFFSLKTTVGSQLFRTIEMPESTSLLVFVVFCAEKSNVGSR
jgi:hypothetical protein